MSNEAEERAATIAANLSAVRQRIAAAATRVGRAVEAVTLVAVSKTYPIEDVVSAYAAGQRDFGENRVEELWPKVHAAQALGLHDLRWHLIGTLQSRKTPEAVGPFALIHAVDRLKIAARLSRDALAAGCTMPILLEVNISGEASKHGFRPDEVLASAHELREMGGVQVKGLMTMAPYEAEPEATRPVFRELAALRDQLAAKAPELEWSELSMGMTNDFEIAVEEGATLVRVGSAIFGARET